MATSLLDGILFSCSHQFSWPRRSDAGDYYQVCLRCGAEYAYDWNAMRRTTRIDSGDGERSVSTKAGRRPVRRAWVPRERRIKHEVPVLYRECGMKEWLHGTCENVSRSGVLISAALPIEDGLDVEVMLEMPTEITGQEHNNVLCQGTCVRTMPGRKEGVCNIAISISGYEFIAMEKAC
jgi:hypothetical protein